MDLQKAIEIVNLPCQACKKFKRKIEFIQFVNASEMFREI